ncbi:MAG: ATP-binding protein [Selenomonadaceae bacterium]|nr:ATP-binding protein [Selenomonadaceae bacterium]
MLYNKDYLEQLMQLKDHFSIKVITGVRGIGKTKLLSEFVKTLKEHGIPNEQIIFINFDEIENITDFQQLYEFINEKIMYLEQAYLIFDEIQQVQGWEKAINAFFVGSPVDIYISSSNNGILSEDFLHLLSDHYELIHIYPLTFNEYLKKFSDTEKINNDSIFKYYLKYGGFPILTHTEKDSEILPTLLSGIYYTALTKDIISRYGVRDADLLDSLNRCLAENLGKAITPKVIETYLSNIGKITTGYTMDNYLKMINESGIFCRIYRYDIKSKTKVNGSERFYCADTGIYNSLMNFNSDNINATLENIVCIELWRQGYEVFVGKIGEQQVNFVAIKNSQPVYIQVIDTIDSKSKLRKMLNPLQRIPDQYNKMILSMDYPKINDYNGIKHFNIFDFINRNI